MTDETIQDEPTTDEPSVPADEPETVEDPATKMTLAELYIANYVPVELAILGTSREPRTQVALKSKAADIALQLTGFALRAPQQP